MSSSFRRGRVRRNNDDKSSIAGRKGTKPWTGGITLTSVGLRDLDAILGGGQPVGTCLLLEEDRWTRDLALCLLKYWCAEAISHEQVLLAPFFQADDPSLFSSAPSFGTSAEDNLPSSMSQQGASTAELNSLMDGLPRNLHWDKAAGKVVVEDVKARPLEILEEEEGEEDAEEGLTIAWQYRKSIQDERLGKTATTVPTQPAASNVYCHSFDLNGRLNEQSLNADCFQLVDGTCCCEQDCSKLTCGVRLFSSLKQQLKEQLVLTKSGKLIRMLLYQAPIQIASIAVPLLLAHIRAENLPVVVLVTVHSWIATPDPASLISLRRSVDVVMQTEGFASRIHYPPPAEFRHLHGLLLLPKVSTVTAAAAGHFADMTMSKRPAAHVYGLKRDRRKLHVSLLHIPPEEFAGEGSVGGGGVRSGAGRPQQDTGTGGCSSGGGGNSPLDF